MNTKSFVGKLNQITKALFSMTPAQREKVHQSIQALDAEISTDELIQPLFDVSSQCPHCHSRHLKKWGKSGAIQRYRCKDCQKTFNNKTNTPLAKLHKCHLWEEYARCMVLKLTLREAADICGINLKTAFLWRHRFLMAQAGKNQDKLSGIIEVDEFFLARSEKGSKTLAHQKKPRKRGGNLDKRTKEGQVTVLLSIDRSNHMINAILSADTRAEIAAHLTENITENSVLCSDGSWSYVEIAKQKNCDHKRLINNQVRVIDKVYHIQTVNGAIAHFKGWVNGKMKGVATKYLSNYLAWFKESHAKLDKQQILVAAYG
ncbi:IS1595 family transposase [Thalassomonas haliotis]|uniref:IS1595 family transposase n=1 Tax=Thalassomonas haliotis TaxID=485448 RepID=A0ABY7VG96_9GAMM|nr:IS1595 family transposase [Thalassomonas haliotis]WDE09433.1 IS1595 family transposase [Thalassomonas haliotis]WDE09607.1 IS1595 family transposase [Thalassomonas haliotis]WDE12734.1 IS1595 family transposase [Thalassomonas haliotis]